MIVVLSGGTGTPKLLQGLKEVISEEEIAVIVNTAEDCWLPHGYFSPDVDTVLYTLSDRINEETWYGIRGDTFATHEALTALGFKEVLRIGDEDRATHIQRGELLRNGKKLSEAIEIQRKALGIKSRVFPMSDEMVETRIVTGKKEMSFHEFWVENRGRPKVLDFFFRGIEKAKGCKKAVKAIEKASGIIIGPSNPVSSVLPIISLADTREAMQEKKERCVAISPIVSGKPLSGPADKFMRAKGLSVSSQSVAELYSELISSIVIHNTDKIEGIKCFKTNIIMRSMEDKKRLAKYALRVLEK